MEKDITIVLKDKCPLDVLSEMGKQTENSWIFFHQNLFENLKNRKGVHGEEREDGTYTLTWGGTKECPENEVTVDICGITTVWRTVTAISSKSKQIAFSLMCMDPENIFFIKMKE